jgi:hypothetical protein
MTNVFYATKRGSTIMNTNDLTKKEHTNALKNHEPHGNHHPHAPHHPTPPHVAPNPPAPGPAPVQITAYFVHVPASTEFCPTDLVIVCDKPTHAHFKIGFTVHNASPSPVVFNATLSYADPWSTSPNWQPLNTDVGGDGNGTNVLPNLMVGATANGTGTEQPLTDTQATFNVGWTPPVPIDDNAAILIQVFDTASTAPLTTNADDHRNAEWAFSKKLPVGMIKRANHENRTPNSHKKA